MEKKNAITTLRLNKFKSLLILHLTESKYNKKFHTKVKSFHEIITHKPQFSTEPNMSLSFHNLRHLGHPKESKITRPEHHAMSCTHFIPQLKKNQTNIK